MQTNLVPLQASSAKSNICNENRADTTVTVNAQMFI